MISGVGGCLRKVDLLSLQSILADGDPTSPLGRPLPDVEITAIPASAKSLGTSVDLIFNFGLEPHDFGWVAVTHALSDLYAALATPLVATVALGVRPGRVPQGALIMDGVREALQAHGTALGGGHTVYSERTFLSISVVGTDPVSPVAQLAEDVTYRILLSKPLGIGVYIAARGHDLGLVQPDQWATVLDTLRTSNLRASQELRSTAAMKLSSLAFVTDITGFGLLTALRTSVPAGWTATITSGSVPYLSGSSELVKDHGISTSLGDHNMVLAMDDSLMDLSQIPMATLLQLSDPQTSGGLLAAVSPDVGDQLTHEGTTIWTEIGTMSHSADLQRVRITPNGGAS